MNRMDHALNRMETSGRGVAPHTSLGLYIILKLWGLSEKVCGSCGSVRFNAVQRSPGESEMQRAWRVNAPHVNRMKTITRFEWSGP